MTQLKILNICIILLLLGEKRKMHLREVRTEDVNSRAIVMFLSPTFKKKIECSKNKKAMSKTAQLLTESYPAERAHAA